MQTIRGFGSLTLAGLLLIGVAACSRTAEGVVSDTRDNVAKTKAAVETLDVKTAIIADKTVGRRLAAGRLGLESGLEARGISPSPKPQGSRAVCVRSSD
jgi:hypothetical protein